MSTILIYIKMSILIKPREGAVDEVHELQYFRSDFPLIDLKWNVSANSYGLGEQFPFFCSLFHWWMIHFRNYFKIPLISILNRFLKIGYVQLPSPFLALDSVFKICTALKYVTNATLWFLSQRKHFSFIYYCDKL